ncbi:MAG: FapA family protein, partial [Oscillospiraceae bacterium]|nr:FapA family protein [Oscillospiraceae bacterium]
DKHIAPVEDENGVVDYKNLGLINNITSGTPIAEISMPTEGTPGTDITGKHIPQRVGTPAKFNVGAGTQLVNNDTEIIAAIDGNLVFKNGAFVVEEKIVINGDVDVSSGNIDFIGDVLIKGGVFEGFRVASKRNISIMGLVTNAEIIAAGDVSVKIGVINSKVQSKANVKVGFCENSTITAEGSVESPSFVGGEVFAGEKIIASGKGVMVGGKYTALNGVEASVIGSENYTKTLITLGNNAVLSEEREKLEKENATMEEQADQLAKILLTLAEHAKKGKLSPERDQMQTDARRNRLRLLNSIRANQKRIAEIDEALQLTQNLCVEVKRMVYPGVTLRINSSVHKVNAVQNRVKAVVRGGDIAFVPL